MFLILSKDPSSFDYIDESLKNDRDFILSLLEKNGRVFYYIPMKFQSDRDFVVEAMRLNGKCYPFIGAFKDDPELASLACMDMVWHLDEFLANHPQFRKDTNFILSCVSRNDMKLLK